MQGKGGTNESIQYKAKCAFLFLCWGFVHYYSEVQRKRMQGDSLEIMSSKKKKEQQHTFMAMEKAYQLVYWSALQKHALLSDRDVVFLVSTSTVVTC